MAANIHCSAVHAFTQNYFMLNSSGL